MPPDFDLRLRAMAEVIVRVGVNLQPGQPLLVTDPYELQGIPDECSALVEVIRACAGNPVEVIRGDVRRLRSLVESGDGRGYGALVSDHIGRLRRHLSAGGAFLFLTGGAPQLFHGLPAGHLARCEETKWRHLGPLIQQLVRGATQWTLAPAPTLAWADLVYGDLPVPARLPALWRTVFASLHVDSPKSLSLWESHLAALARRRDALNAARHQRIRYTGLGTDLTVTLPRSHAWCTAQQVTTRGIPYVANLPTEEVFTAPDKDSAKGRVRVARPVVHAGTVIDGVTLEFVGGRVVAAHVTSGQSLLDELLATDAGARQLGEVALVPERSALSLAGRHFHHPLLDENVANHIALGDAYRFCSRAWWPRALNSSRIHLDLPLEAVAELS